MGRSTDPDQGHEMKCVDLCAHMTRFWMYVKFENFWKTADLKAAQSLSWNSLLHLKTNHFCEWVTMLNTFPGTG